MHINEERYEQLLTQYKEDLQNGNWWIKAERFKWAIFKQYKDNWNIESNDFVNMAKRSIGKEFNYIFVQTQPWSMIVKMTEKDPEYVRKMFRKLYNEDKDYLSRILEFKKEADDFCESKLDRLDGKPVHSWQTRFTIALYLMLEFPNKYTACRPSDYITLANEIDSDYTESRKSPDEKLTNSFELLSELSERFVNDKELNDIMERLEDDDCFKDEHKKLQAFDFAFYVDEQIKKTWSPTDYAPNIDVDTWVDLIEDPDVCNNTNKIILSRFMDIGGQATCKQLSKKYGNPVPTYISNSVSFARRVQEKTGCEIPKRENEDSRWWPILFLGQNTSKKSDGVFIWKLRDELKEALEQVSLPDPHTQIGDEPVSVNEQEKNHRYWWLNASPKIWSFSSIEVGSEQEYTLYNDNHNKRRIFQHFLDAKPGDIIVGYESTPVKKIVALATVTKGHSTGEDGDTIGFKKTRTLVHPIDLETLQDIQALEGMEPFVNTQGSLFELSTSEYETIVDLIADTNPIVSDKATEGYTKKDFLSEVYMPEEAYDELKGLLSRKMNIVLQGAPGVGKTFAARRLAYSIMGEKDNARIEQIQFHQSYSYEDFVIGYRPDGDGFELKAGKFLDFCKTAENDPARSYFMIIDEINRGNVSKIFGELLSLIEKEYRGTRIKLAYGEDYITIPKNLFIIGMMNTADRSLARLDYALRRRFCFYDIAPGFDTEGFKAYTKNHINNALFDKVIMRVIELNKDLSSDVSLGSGCRIGHSYFCNYNGDKSDKDVNGWLLDIINYEIAPLLREYWFDDLDKANLKIDDLKGPLNV